jgi:hypothetical protein
MEWRLSASHNHRPKRPPADVLKGWPAHERDPRDPVQGQVTERCPRGPDRRPLERDLSPQAAPTASGVTSPNLPVDDLVSAVPRAGPA